MSMCNGVLSKDLAQSINVKEGLVNPRLLDLDTVCAEKADEISKTRRGFNSFESAPQNVEVVVTDVGVASIDTVHLEIIPKCVAMHTQGIS